MKRYAVLRYMRYLEVFGKEGSLPEGHGFIPVFDRYEEAVEYADGGKYQILEMTTATHGVNDE